MTPTDGLCLSSRNLMTRMSPPAKEAMTIAGQIGGVCLVQPAAGSRPDDYKRSSELAADKLSTLYHCFC